MASCALFIKVVEKQQKRRPVKLAGIHLEAASSKLYWEKGGPDMPNGKRIQNFKTSKKKLWNGSKRSDKAISIIITSKWLLLLPSSPSAASLWRSAVVYIDTPWTHYGNSCE